jgi:molecular chaperone GrpE
VSDEQTPETEGVEVADELDSVSDAPVQETGQESSAEDGQVEAGTTPDFDAVAELTGDLQRLQAEFANYRKRVERDRELVREQVIAGTLSELLPVLDDIGRAREHGDLEGAFKSVGESLESTVNRLGLKAFGVDGDAFDPTRHEAISHDHSDEVDSATCAKVFQPGYEFAGRIVRPAIVSVVEPSTPSSPTN